MVEEYKVGGPLSEKDTTYVLREADEQLYNALKNREFCYVLDSRQSGKSSLCIKTRIKFREDLNIKDVYISLLELGVQNTPEEWYNGQLIKIIKGLKINIDFNTWWNKYVCPPLQKYSLFIEEVLLIEVKTNIVIFVDEIDTVLSSNFSTDDFFAFIKGCYENRPHNPEYNRLTFCLLGRTSPNKLIEDPTRTPFNIGQPIILKPFQYDLERLEPLMRGWKNKFKHPEKVMEEIIKFSGGQPFLTQKLCQLMVKESTKENPNSVEQVVESQIINYIQSGNDYQEHFTTIRDHLLCEKTKKNLKDYSQVIRDNNRSFDLLSLYQKTLLEGLDSVEKDPLQIELKLTGVVVEQEGKLKVYNPIYEKIFHKDWILKELKKIRFYAEKLTLWNQERKQNESKSKKELYLLYGFRFEEAWRYKEERGMEFITGLEYNFILDSKEFWETAQKSLPKGSDYEVLIKVIMDWTGGVKHFNDIFFEIARSEYQEPPAMGTEKDWMGDLVTSHLSNFCQPDSIEKQFMDDNDPNIDRFRLICSYQEILQTKAITFDESPEHKKLATMCLIIKNQEDKKLRILNKIYEYIFNQAWVNKILDYICPYANDFQKWDASVNKDESLLLKGEDLQTALQWIQNKNELSELELEFIITSIVWEKWQSDDAVNKVKKILPQLKEKTQPPAHLVRVIQAILEGTKPQLLLLKEVLQWVGEAEVIPTEDGAKWLKGVVRSHLIKNFSTQKLSEYLDYSNSSNAIWQEVKNENAFIIIDEFLEKEKPSQEDIDTVKNYQKRLDKAQVSIYTTESATNFQPLILDILYSKFERAYNMAGQKEFDQLLDKIVADAGGDLEAIIIFDLSEGLPLYHNKGLKDRNSKLYSALFGEGDIGGEAIEGFDTLEKMQQAFRNFGEKTEFKEPTSINVNFANGKMMIYFHQTPDIPTAVCFMASKDINLGSINRRANQFISNIKQKLDEV